MNFSTMPCGNTVAERQHDLRCQSNLKAEQAAKAEAERMYRDSELDDEIMDLIADHPIDAGRIALAVLDWLDTNPTDTEFLKHLSLEVRDFRATVQGVIDECAKREES